MKALLGVIPATVSNANVINVGQMPDMPLGSVVETNCVFSLDSVKPVAAKRLPEAVNALVLRNAQNIENTYYGIKHRNVKEIFEAFINQPLCSNLALSDGRELFNRMTEKTKEYLKDYYSMENLRV